MPTPAIQVRDVTFAYPHSGWRLGPITLEIAAGRLTGIIGPNGSGKSTLMAILARQVRGAGETSVFDVPISR